RMNGRRSERSGKRVRRAGNPFPAVPAPRRGLLGLARRWVRDHASDGSQGESEPEPAGDPAERERPARRTAGGPPGPAQTVLPGSPGGDPETGTPESGGTDPRDPGVVAALAAFPGATVVRCPQCGGTIWRPNLAGDGEYCPTCGCVSPLTASA